ncbi:MAG: radical SAM family heme chaperone HemW [Acidobacteriota bacterium]|nr:radical SAM family heme chaperone HemW [Acidobacteriota bacterium]
MDFASQIAPSSVGVYVQVPFCQAKCSYCNFSTGVFRAEAYAPYVDAVCAEILGHAAFYRDAGLGVWQQAAGRAAVDTIYIGGGTPSLLAPGELGRILDAVRRAFDGSPSEVTLEADPETVTEEKARAWREAGFNRVSLGSQSFSDVELKAVGRRHRRADIYTAIECLREAGLDNVSFDLIAGLPHQTRESWHNSLEELLSLRPRHISIYLLELDEGSRLGRETLAGGLRYGVAALPEDDAAAASYEHACERLVGEGYDHYEISNWALPGFRSRHNLKYWRREPYLGFGAGAHSFDGVERWANSHDPMAYAASIKEQRLPVEQRESVDARQALEEELFLGLRQLDGIDLESVERRYQVDLGERLRPLEDEGLVETYQGRLRLAPSRLTVSNEVFVRLLD